MSQQLLLLGLGAVLSSSLPSSTIVGPPTLVYGFYASHCPRLPQTGCSLSIAEGCDCDIADAPMRMWRRSGSDSQVFSLASVDLGSRAMIGSSPTSLQHSCSLYANSTRHQAFGEYANYEWIHSSWYFSANNTVYALTHMEWDCKSADTCAFYGQGYTFFSAVTLMMSPDGGGSWRHALPPPAHIVAVSPVPWTEAIGASGQSFGFRSPSSIVAGRGAQSGFFFASVTAGWGSGAFQGQAQGACMMRTRDLTDPAAWRAWGGAGFTVSLAASPYGREPPPDPAAHACTPFSNITYASLLWSEVFEAYMYFGTAQGNDHGGWQFMLSSDLESWSGLTTVAAPQQYIVPAGNASWTPSGRNFTGRFVMPQGSSDPQVWWEDDARAVKRRVGSCTPCPGVSACSSIVRISASEFNALVERAAFSCSWMFNTSGYSDYYYPTLIDPSSASDNFDSAGPNALLFLVAQACANVGGDGKCTPFDQDGLLVRDLIRAPVSFSN